MDYTEINSCRGCHSGNDSLRVVLEMDPMPLAGQFCASREDALSASTYPLTWVRCAQCGLVQVLEDVHDKILFSTYNYSSSTVGGLVRHFEEYAEFLTNRFGRDQNPRLLEIGCNDGVLLNQLPDSWRLAGVDPSDVARRAAEYQSHYELLNASWSLNTARQSGLEGSMDVVTGSNCLAHISDLKETFKAAALALKPGGEFWLEVHDLASTLKGAQWDTIYHEHKVEWSEESLCRCLEPLGLKHVSTIELPLHGGLLRCGFRREEAGTLRFSGAPSDLPGLQRLADAYRNRRENPAVRKLMAALASGEPVAAYGAAGRANVYLNQIPELKFGYIIDESPLRAGKFIPRTATPVAPLSRLNEERPSMCLITAWNYASDIIEKNPNFAGEWLTAW